MENQIDIMLIDDNGIDLFLHEKLISLQPFTKSVIKFTNATDSISHLKNNSEKHWPDIILLDIQMPLFDGFAFLEQYELLPVDCRKKCSIIMVSSSLNFIDINRARQNSQVLDLLMKPLSIEQLEVILLNKKKANQ